MTEGELLQMCLKELPNLEIRENGTLIADKNGRYVPYVFRSGTIPMYSVFWTNKEKKGHDTLYEGLFQGSRIDDLFSNVIEWCKYKKFLFSARYQIDDYYI